MKQINMNENELDDNTGTNHAGNRANQPVRVLTASSIMKDKVFNTAGEHLGRITDIMLNLEKGKIEYVVIAFGGFMGIGEKYFAIPFEDLTVSTEQHAFILDRTRESLESQPGFDRDHWPEANLHSQSSSNYGGFMGVNTGSDH